MFEGEKINVTEKSAVVHIALRAPKGATIVVDGENVVPLVHAVLARMVNFSGCVRNGSSKWLSTASTVPGFIGFAVGLVTRDLLRVPRDERTQKLVRGCEPNRPPLSGVNIFEEKARAA